VDFAVGRVNPAGRGPPHPSVIGWLRLWFRQRRRCTISTGCQPSRTVQSSATGNLAVCLVLYVAHFMPRNSLPPPCRKRLQINKNHFDSTVAAFGICLNQRHPVNILTHIETRRLLPCISPEELGAESLGSWPLHGRARHREGSRRGKP